MATRFCVWTSAFLVFNLKIMDFTSTKQNVHTFFWGVQVSTNQLFLFFCIKTGANRKNTSMFSILIGSEGKTPKVNLYAVHCGPWFLNFCSCFQVMFSFPSVLVFVPSVVYVSTFFVHVSQFGVFVCVS